VVEHIVLFKLKSSVSAEQKQAFIEALRGMKGRVPGMVDLSAGESFTERHKGYTVGLVVRVTDRDALAVYDTHEVHRPVKEMAGQLSEEILAVDYEF